MALVNVMVEIVEERLELMLQTENCCKCERCLEDMKAIALNKLPAKYVSTGNGELFTKLNSTARQNTVDINVAVSSAIEFVSEHPLHEPRHAGNMDD
ncbi:MAG: late competence development ComFB family protein [Oscillospiraceae bacterium]|nr:late competence development ComFB family protein [Oscillospiraceae bacterium]